MNTYWFQKEITLQPRSRGFHLISKEIEMALPELAQIRLGLANLFIQHTSASLTINENADPDVRSDMEKHFSNYIPENAPYYDHVLEGSDDMPAHIKATTIGASLVIPISEGRLALGTWQGIYLGEHRNNGGRRKVIVTLQGQK